MRDSSMLERAVKFHDARRVTSLCFWSTAQTRTLNKLVFFSSNGGGLHSQILTTPIGGEWNEVERWIPELHTETVSIDRLTRGN